MSQNSLSKNSSFSSSRKFESSSNFLSRINWALLFFSLVLIGVGLINTASTSAIISDSGVIEYESFLQRQFIWAGMGIGCMLVVSFINYHKLSFIAYPFYVFVIILLVLVPIIGVKAGGAQRWLNIGFMNIQPSEFAKFAILIVGAKVLAKDGDALSWVRLLKVLCIGMLPFALVVIQPDLGTSLILLFILGGIVLFHGIKWQVLRVLLIIVPLALPFAWLYLKDYQKQRILTFLDPTKDPHGAGYNIIQSQIAIGSGEFFGKGFQHGSQNQLQFLPEKHTDFAIAVLAEEWGFIGILFTLTVFCLFLYSIYNGAKNSKDRFGSLLCAGIFFYFFLQILINIGMVVGIMPVVGMPLPFISYGGSAMLVNCLLIGIALNVSAPKALY